MDDDDVFDLKIILNRQKQRNDTRKKIYKDFLSKIYKRIEHSSRHDSTECIYEFPQVIIGSPLYNIEACTTYICEKLRKNKFKTELSNKRLLKISWKHLV